MLQINTFKTDSMDELNMKLAAARPSSAAQGGVKAFDMAHSDTSAVFGQQWTSTLYKIDVVDQDIANTLMVDNCWRNKDEQFELSLLI